MQMHMVVCVDMVQSETREAKGFELRPDFRFQLALHPRVKKELDAGAD